MLREGLTDRLCSATDVVNLKKKKKKTLAKNIQEQCLNVKKEKSDKSSDTDCLRKDDKNIHKMIQ